MFQRYEPNNIKFGEMYFSKLICLARNKDKIKVLYSTNRLIHLEKNPDAVKHFTNIVERVIMLIAK